MLAIEYVRPQQLNAAPYNPRQITRQALRVLARLLDEHGFIDPVIARREDNLVLGGHQRIRANALRKKPDRKIPCVFLDGISDGRAKALNVALNNPSAQGRFDVDGLARLLGEIAADEPDISAVTGFSADQVADMTAALDDLPEPAIADAPPAAEAACDVVLIFELTRNAYERVKGEFDRLIARHDLVCHVRFGDEQ